MNITIQFLVYAATHELPTDEENIRLIRGDIIGVFESSEVPEPPSVNSKTMFLRINDFPDTLSINKRRLAEEHKNFFTNEIGEQDSEILHKRKYYFDQTLITVDEYNLLAVNKQLFVTWDRVKEVLKNKETGMLIEESELM